MVVAKTKMAEFKMAVIIKLIEDEWVWSQIELDMSGESECEGEGFGVQMVREPILASMSLSERSTTADGCIQHG